MLLGPLFALLLASGTRASRCCGDRGDNGLEWRTLWKLRAQLCRDTTANEPVDGGYTATTDVYDDSTDTWNQYAFWGRDPSGDFDNCWNALRELISGCGREAHAASGFWELEDEMYAMSLPAATMQKRSTAAKRHLRSRSNDELSSFSEGIYNINGTEITVLIENTLHDLPQTPVPASCETYPGTDYPAHAPRSELQTNDGVTTDWDITTTFEADLQSILANDIEEMQSARGDWPLFAPPSETCSLAETGKQKYTALQIGTWNRPWERVSDCLAYGWYNAGGHFQGSGETFSASWSAPLSEDIEDAAVESATCAGHSVSRSYTQDDITGCYWTKGVCHVMWTQQPMVWQRGLVIEYLDPDFDSFTAIVKFVHIDLPQTTATSGCDAGCCATCPNNVPYNSPLRAWHCAAYASGEEGWYGVCDDWDQNPFVTGKNVVSGLVLISACSSSILSAT